MNMNVKTIFPVDQQRNLYKKFQENRKHIAMMQAVEKSLRYTPSTRTYTSKVTVCPLGGTMLKKEAPPVTRATTESEDEAPTPSPPARTTPGSADQAAYTG
jgi:hypothetical protein